MKTLRIFTMFALSCALLSCGNEKNGDISQLSSPKVIQDEAKTTKTSVAAFWTEVAGAASYNVIFDDRDVVSTTEKEMAWDNLETNSTHTLKVQAVSADKNAFKDSEWSVAVLTTTEDTELDTPFTMSFHDVTFYNAKVTVNAGTIPTSISSMLHLKCCLIRTTMATYVHLQRIISLKSSSWLNSARRPSEICISSSAIPAKWKGQYLHLLPRLSTSP